jgi:putative transposase
MPRRARRIVGGGFYHVMDRGNNRAVVFREPHDYREFLWLVSIAQSRIELDLFALCLMPNHFHMVVRPHSEDQLGQWMHWLLTTHTTRHHRRHGTCGRLWQGRYKDFPVEPGSHLMTVFRYVERNALRAGLVGRAEHWPWGSLAWRAGLHAGPALSAPPEPLPAGWLEHVNEPQSEAELMALRVCSSRQRPFGSEGWTKEVVDQRGLQATVRPRGRPPRVNTRDDDEE